MTPRNDPATEPVNDAGDGFAPQWLGPEHLPAIAADAARLAVYLEQQAATVTVNYCGHRYYFWVTLFACLLAKRRALLPPSAERQAAKRILPAEPKLLLDDELVAKHCQYRADDQLSASSLLAKAAAAPRFVTVFTSGSTGAPKPIDKTWQSLAGRAASYVDTVFPAASRIVAMVPQQHMYGLETSQFTSLLDGFTVYGSSTAYPAAVAEAVSNSERPVVLVSTPMMLQLLLKSAVSLQELAGIVSATSPLSADLKREVELRFGCAVTEIYGFSEAGSVAWRRDTEAWQLLPGLRAVQQADSTVVCDKNGPFARIEDSVELIGDNQLLLKGRPADLVKIGGKRASLAGLTQQLLQLPMIDDAHISYSAETSRLEAFVVSTDSPREIRRAFAARCDLSFVPRKIQKVSRIPRSAAGKVTAEGLALLRQEAVSS